jgi:branched-chain amino acid transport system substrate-binding protein
LYLKTTGDDFVPAFAADGYMLVNVLASAIDKAKTTDTEKVIDVLKTLSLETPKGTLKMRSFDMKCNLGEWWGITKFDPSLGYSVLTDVKYIHAEPLMHTAEEVAERRTK